LDEAAIINHGPALADWLSNPANEGKVVQTRLRASERVIARVTDGIYRQPASALRELISNAWDADAANVTILTDAPRFSRIYVRDDGAGMSDERLRGFYTISGAVLSGARKGKRSD
jgi:signal transduction histidine kinase